MAQKLRDLKFSVKDKVGVLAKVTKALKDARVNMLHIAAWTEGNRGYFDLVTNNNARAQKALQKIGIRASQGEILAVTLQNKAGSLERVAKKLAKAGVSIKSLFATTGGKRVSVLLKTKNDRKALRVA